MDDILPAEFPPEWADQVLAEKIRSTRVFEEAKQKAHSLREIEYLLIAHSMRVFLVFVRLASELVRQRVWSASQLEREAKQFLRRFTNSARTALGRDKSGNLVAEVVSSWGSGILPEVQRCFERTPQWRAYQDMLLSLAEGASASVSCPGDVAWEDVEISFLSDERVQMIVCGRMETRNYAELGFEDRRSGKPSQPWEVLRVLSRAGGVLPDVARDSKEFTRTAKHIERIRRKLKDHFHIASDPIPHDPVAASYRTRFKIGCAPSFCT